ncbi:uncharacterized protein MKK02DRAFT_29826 [Dioszegia hungarica]|uniref:Uncharacterized protein n=1 Tax=Dioszegia hungarica TaxID=4972 RepID=A0AA38HGT5_9TREE|nr:uncharacterized protein MKK02DRAFT_29826 [Dioszegia hungarica]KAI9639861.1 hypothetical protein MKK02DRAFT_29826 [Dioszegia hungarica]
MSTAKFDADDRMEDIAEFATLLTEQGIGLTEDGTPPDLNVGTDEFPYEIWSPSNLEEDRDNGVLEHLAPRQTSYGSGASAEAQPSALDSPVSLDYLTLSLDQLQQEIDYMRLLSLDDPARVAALLRQRFPFVGASLSLHDGSTPIDSTVPQLSGHTLAADHGLHWSGHTQIPLLDEHNFITAIPAAPNAESLFMAPASLAQIPADLAGPSSGHHWSVPNPLTIPSDPPGTSALTPDEGHCAQAEAQTVKRLSISMWFPATPTKISKRRYPKRVKKSERTATELEELAAAKSDRSTERQQKSRGCAATKCTFYTEVSSHVAVAGPGEVKYRTDMDPGLPKPVEIPGVSWVGVRISFPADCETELDTADVASRNSRTTTVAQRTQRARAFCRDLQDGLSYGQSAIVRYNPKLELVVERIRYKAADQSTAPADVGTEDDEEM